MVTFNPAGRLLIALFDLTRSGEIIELFSLSESAGLNLYRTLSELDSLAKRGLVDAGKLRLTLAGVAVAASLDRRSRAQAARLDGAAGVVQLSRRVPREQPERSEQELFARELVA